MKRRNKTVLYTDNMITMYKFQSIYQKKSPKTKVSSVSLQVTKKNQHAKNIVFLHTNNKSLEIESKKCNTIYNCSKMKYLTVNLTKWWVKSKKVDNIVKSYWFFWILDPRDPVYYLVALKIWVSF